MYGKVFMMTPGKIIWIRLAAWTLIGAMIAYTLIIGTVKLVNEVLEHYYQ